MEAINTWLRDVFVTPSVLETLVWLTLVSALGLSLGKLRVGKLSLGITFVFFVGILAAHFGVRVHPEMNRYRAHPRGHPPPGLRYLRAEPTGHHVWSCD